MTEKQQMQIRSTNPNNPTSWHSLQPAKVLSLLNSNQEEGLDESEARARQNIYGKNTLEEDERVSPFLIFGKQLASPLILILFAATIISAVLGEILDAIIVMVIIILTAIVSFVQEHRSEKAIAALKSITSPTASAIRNGRQVSVRSEDLVPGDLIVVAQGDKVPADAYLLKSHSLQTNEASLTGESMPVAKIVRVLDEKVSIAERENILFSGTTVTFGRGKGVVIGIGHATEFGKIATSVKSVKKEKTPFEQRMSQIGRFLSITTLGIVGIITVLGIYRGHSIIDMLIWGISIGVAAIPEALPAVTATSLTIGVYKMAKKNAIVRRLPAVETLGAVTVICSDKTGTLTTGRMIVRKVFADNSEQAVNNHDEKKRGMQMLAHAVALCNDSVLAESNQDGNRNQNGNSQAPAYNGDPTEVALTKFSSSILGITKEKLDSQFLRVFEIPFSSERKMMTTVHKLADKDMQLAVTKGAPENILKICNSRIDINGNVYKMDKQQAEEIAKANDRFALEALRVLAVSYKEIDAQLENKVKDLEKDMVFLGLIGIIDPPRAETIEALSQCHSAGIRVVMITGDNRTTAEAIAKEIGMENEVIKSIVGSEIDGMTDEELRRAVLQTNIFARVLPEHKLRITRSLKENGHVVAMTGDGINDAPALKAAHIGVAMGITGTQVAKEASSMILADDNFATIVTAIKEGRRIMDNVKKYLVYLLSASIGELLLFSSALIIGLPMPLLAKHILYINLATDGSPAIALGTEPAESDIMRRPPRSMKKGIFEGTLAWLVGISLTLGAASLFLFWYILASNGWTDFAEAKARTMVFGLMIFFEIFFAYSSRSFRNSVIKMKLLSNKPLLISMVGESTLVFAIMTIPALQSAFSLIPLQLNDWFIILALASLGFAYMEAAKAIRAHLNRGGGIALAQKSNHMLENLLKRWDTYANRKASKEKK